MKFFTNKKFAQKIIISILTILMLNFCIPASSYCSALGDASSKLLKEVIQLVVSLGDVVTGAFNHFMLGTSGYDTSMINRETLIYNLDDANSVFYAGTEEADVIIEDGEMDKKDLFDVSAYQYPNMLYSPENIFANKIGMLDVNFLKPNKYTSVSSGEVVDYDENADSLKDQDNQVSAAEYLSPTIASWYRSFRNIAIVALLTVLVYIGIKILLSSTASDKAKYKQNLADWFVALCLVLAIHIIMSGILILTDIINDVFAEAATDIIVQDNTNVGDGNTGLKFKTNLMGLVRFKAQSEAWQEAVANSLIYLVLVIYTIVFTFQYLKRFLYMAFFTMMAPLVAITYPIDKAGDGKAQAFNMWFKEYTVNAIIQPIHLLLYTALVGTSVSLAVKNPLYAVVAIGFMIPAEKFIKKMFGISAESDSGMGSFAGGALAMTGLQKLASLGKGSSKSGGSGSSKSTSSAEEKDGDIRFARESAGGTFDSFNNGLVEGSAQSNRENREIEEPQTEQQQMLDAYDDNYGTEQWDAQERDAYAREAYNNDGGMQYSDEEYANILRDSGYSEEEIASMMGTDVSTPENNEEESSEPSQIDTNDGQSQNNVQQTQSQQTQQIQSTQQTPQKGWRGRVIKARAGQMAPKVLNAAKGTAKFAARVVGGTAGGAIGLAAGIASGDPSKAFTYAAGGAVAGNAIAGNATSAVGKFAKGMESLPGKFEKRDERIQYTHDEAKYGAAEARRRKIERENQRATQRFLEDEASQQKWDDVRGKLAAKGYSGTTKELMNVVADYKKADPKMEDRMIEKALELEQQYGDKKIGGSAHKQIMDVATFTSKNGYGKEYVEDKEKRKVLDQHIDSKVSNAQVRKQIKEMHAKLNGVEHLRP